MDFLIRTVEKKDNAELAKIIRSCFHDFNAPTTGTVYEDSTTDKLHELFSSTPNSILFVAELQGEVVGCCGLYPTLGLNNTCVELVKFYLIDTHRGKGIGKKLFENCIATAKDMGYKEIYIESLPEFSAAIQLYEQFEFRMLDKPLGDSGHSGCNIWMIKKLS